MFLVQVVLSLEDVYNRKLRSLASEFYSNKKGAMSEVVEHGLDLFEKEARRNSVYLKLLMNARNAGKLGVKSFNRADAYD